MSTGPQQPPSRRPRGGPPWMQYPSVGDMVVYNGRPAVVAAIKDADSYVVDVDVFVEGGEITEETDVAFGLEENQWHPRLKDLREPAVRRFIPPDMVRDIMSMET